MTHYISAEHLTIERVGEIIEKGIKLALSDDAKARSRLWRDHRLWLVVQREGEQGPVVATANQPDDVSRLWRGRACA